LSIGLHPRRGELPEYQDSARTKKVSKKSTEKKPAKLATASPAPAALGKPEIKKIQGLLKSKTADGVTLGLSLLESLGATKADYEAVFTETVIKSVLSGWVEESWVAVAKALVPHGAVSELFQKLAEEKFLKRPGKHYRFNGFVHARMQAARPAFLSTWGGAARPEKPFIDLVDIRWLIHDGQPSRLVHDGLP